eukprot:GHVL01024477.1.p1 GENE.GHVL01024477.1~~GHVL01024477.1.p1  ORF type:complete len:131 (+),score=0.14 GHVL01024477.1:398-790(+)
MKSIPPWITEDGLCEVGPHVATWWRVNFDQHLYPYLPPHVSRPKEMQKHYVVRIPPQCSFALKEGWKLVCVPLFELFAESQLAHPYETSFSRITGNHSGVSQASRYTLQIATLPAALSTITFSLMTPAAT